MSYILTTFLIPLAIAGVDQLIKHWAVANLQPVGSMPLIPGIVELRFVLNDGAAFSSMAGKQNFLILFTSLAMLVLLAYLLRVKPENRLEYAAWLLILGGGIGNLIDRVMNQTVVDYINLLFMRFAVFNFADICVCTGCGLYILYMILQEVRRKKQDAAA